MSWDGMKSDIAAEIALTERQLALVRAPAPMSRGVLWSAPILLMLNVLAIVLSSRYAMAWIASSLLVMMMLFILTFLPTSRSGSAIDSLSIPFRSLHRAVRTNKPVLAALLASSMLAGSLPMLPGMLIIVMVNIIFAVLLIDPLSIGLMAWIIIQSLLILGFFLWLRAYRPFTGAFLESLTDTIRTVRSDDGPNNHRRRGALSLAAFVLTTVAVLFGIFILPGPTLGQIGSANLAAAMDGIVVLVIVLVTQMLLVRALQARESRRSAIEFLEKRLGTLNGLMAEAEKNGAADLERISATLLMVRLVRLHCHDLNGHLRVFSTFPDLELLLSSEMREELSSLSAVDVLRNADPPQRYGRIER